LPLFALFWNGMVWGMLAGGVRPSRGVSPFVAYGAAGLFVVVGLYLAWKAAEAVLRYRRFGDTTLLLAVHPAVAGGELAGAITIPVPYDPANVYFASVAATEHTAQLSGGKIYSAQQALFEEDAAVWTEPAGTGTRVRFSIALPPEAPPSLRYGESLTWSSGTTDKVYLKWYVHLAADIPGLDLNESFEVPVVRPAATELMPRGPATVPLAAGIAPPLVPPALRRAPLRTGHNRPFEYRRLGERIRVVQPAWKKPGNISSPGGVIAAIAVCGVFAAAGVFLLGQREWLLGAIFFTIGAGLILVILGYLAHELSAEIGPEGVHIVRRIGAFVFKDVRLQRAQVAAVEAAAESQAQQSGGSMITRSVRVRMRDGSTHALAEFMPRQQDAIALRNLVAARLALGVDARVGSAAVAPSRKRTTTAPATGWMKVLGGLLVAGFFVWQAVPFFSERRQPIVAPSPPAAPVQRAALPPPQDWRGAFDQARSALNESRLADAEGLFRQSLAFVEKEHGAGHPAEGVVLHQLALTYERQQRPGDQEATLKRSLAVFEQHRPREAKAALGTLGGFVDQENVARYLGDMYWDRRNYGESFVYFRKAHDAALEVDVAPEIRNMKRAYTSAGVMKTACMIGKWDIADDAMAELKRRYPTVSASTQRYLKYWIETGEPRLQARRC
jgi:hypothetical protein